MADATVHFSRRRPFLIGVGLTVLAIGGGVVWYVVTAGHVSTDDAQLDARVSQIAQVLGMAPGER